VYAKRRDANHRDVGDALRKLGWSVLDIADHGDGIPDYIVSRKRFVALVEVKDGTKPPSARKLTPAEQKVKDSWQGPYIIALSVEDAIAKLAIAMCQA
jgi:Holliday junction resolvase